MNFWQRLSVRSKLLGMAGLGILSLVVVFLINYFYVQKTNHSLKKYEDTFKITEHFDKIEDDIGQIEDTFSSILLGEISPQEGARELDNLLSLVKKDWEEFLKKAETEKDFADLTHLKDFFQKLSPKMTTAIETLQAGDTENFKNILRRDLGPLFEDFERYSDKLANFMDHRSDLSYQSIVKDLTEAEKEILIVFLGALFFLGFSSYALLRQLEKNLRETMETLVEMGQGRFFKSVSVNSQDELGKLARACNSLICGIGQILKTLKVQTEALTRASQNLSRVENTVSDNAHDIGHFAREVAAAAEQVTENLKTVSQAIEELSTATQEIAQNVNETANISQEAREKAEVATRVISSLKESSEKIGQIVQVINQIADQTNLLALNATIEAARAGEAGKGFAVVANEVKELAKQTSEATEEIAGMVSTIQQNVDQAVEAVHSVDEIIAKIGDLSTGIASATEEQTATTEDINRSVQEGISGVIQVNDQIKELANRASHLEEISAELKLAEEAVADIVEEIGTVNQSFEVREEALSQASQEAGESIKVLGMTLEHFQWRERLLIGILEKKRPNVHTDPSRCALGKWLASFRAPDTETGEIVRRLDPEHQELHRSAEEVIHLIEKDAPTKEVYPVLKEKISPKVKRVVSYLTDLRKKLEKFG